MDKNDEMSGRKGEHTEKYAYNNKLIHKQNSFKK